MLYPAELRDLVLRCEAACPPYAPTGGGGGSYATLCCVAKLPVRRIRQLAEEVEATRTREGLLCTAP